MSTDRIAVAVLLASLVTACGGGGSGGGGDAGPEEPLLDGAGSSADALVPSRDASPDESTDAPTEIDPPAGGNLEMTPAEPDAPAETAPPAGGDLEVTPPEPDVPTEVDPPVGGDEADVPPERDAPTDGGGADVPMEPDASTAEPSADPAASSELDGASPTAGYAITLENFWNAEDFPQDFPDDAHLSFVGGATHNASVSFWEPGTTVTPGVEDMAESGRIELLLDEDVRPAIEAGLADSAIAVRRYVDPQVDGVPGSLEFEVALVRDFPRVTLLTMLGPSPDWFVGTDGVSLLVDGRWLETLAVDLPLMDAGTKSNVTPVMHGPGIHPPDPVGTIAYDPANGTYQPSETPQIVARVVFARTR